MTYPTAHVGSSPTQTLVPQSSKRACAIHHRQQTESRGLPTGQSFLESIDNTFEYNANNALTIDLDTKFETDQVASLSPSSGQAALSRPIRTSKPSLTW